MKAAANGFHGQLRIALSDGITPSCLPALLALCRQEEPEVDIRLLEVPLSQQIKGLHDDLYGMCFAQSDDVGESITTETAWSDPLMMVMMSAGLALGLAGGPHMTASREPGVVARPLAGRSPTLTTYLLRREGEASEVLSRFIWRVQAIEVPEGSKPALPLTPDTLEEVES